MVWVASMTDDATLILDVPALVLLTLLSVGFISLNALRRVFLDGTCSVPVIVWNMCVLSRLAEWPGGFEWVLWLHLALLHCCRWAARSSCWDAVWRSIWTHKHLEAPTDRHNHNPFCVSCFFHKTRQCKFGILAGYMRTNRSTKWLKQGLVLAKNALCNFFRDFFFLKSLQDYYYCVIWSHKTIWFVITLFDYVLCTFLSYALAFLFMNVLLMVFLRRTQSTGQEPLRRQGSSAGRVPQPLSAQAIKHIWVRTALFEKVLDKVVQYIVDNAR